jgi:O-antigen/teichoic acid export membrane protein
MHRLRPFRADLLALALLFALALLWFAPVLFPAWSGATLLPYDNLYRFEPWRSLRPGLIPHNDLLSDLVLENAVWKLHIRRTLAQGQLPLWNPQILTGLPFLAAGQASTFYPLNLLFYILPLEAAYGWFSALQIGLAGANLYILGRVLRLRILPAFLGGVIFMFSGFLIVSVVFTMFLAAAVWLPLLLALIEMIIRKQEEKGTQSFQPIVYLAAGVAVIALVVLAGHPELIYYTMLVAGAYTLVRLVVAGFRIRNTGYRIQDTGYGGGDMHSALRIPPPSPNPYPVSRLLKLAIWLLAMVGLGVAAGGVQLLPLLELVPLNFRAGSASYAQVVEWAWPTRHVLTFFLPNVFGNPSHHAWFDLWSRQWVPATVNALGEANDTIFWGIKNYVEGGNYLGIATWVLAAVAVITNAYWVMRNAYQRQNTHSALPNRPRPTTIWFFTGLALVSLLFAFGTPLYALLFYGLPGWNQLHSPFRWVFPFTLSMALLAGVGLQIVLEIRDQRPEIGDRRFSVSDLRSPISGLSILTVGAGLAALLAVVASLFFPTPFLALGERLVAGSDLAQMAFADGHMFWSYQAANLVQFGLAAVGSGLLIWGLLRKEDESRRSFFATRLLPALLIALVALDLYGAHGRFNPAVDPALSPLNPENVPPVVQFLNQREGGENCQLTMVNCQSSAPWRFTTFNLPGEKTFNANVGMYYGWHDVRGYDSIIPAQYVGLMERIAPQAGELLYNRIAPLYSNTGGDPYAVLDNPLLDLLGVKYVLTTHHLPNPTWREIYRDEAIAVYENQEALARVLLVPEARVSPLEAQPLTQSDLQTLLFVESAPREEHALTPASPQLREARISRYTANDVFIDVNLSDRSWLLLADAYFPGWKAYIRPFGGEESDETEVQIYRANSALRAVYLPEAGQWTVRFVYTPMSFKLGLYTSFVAIMTTGLLLLYWLWGRYAGKERVTGEAGIVAKNSLAPMFLSLVNRALDFAYAMLYVRLLGPEGTGAWYFVVAVYGLFEIVSRYGLGTLLTRDVSADKSQSSRYLTNVLALRTLLWLISLPIFALVAWSYRSLNQFSLPWIGLVELQPIGVQEVQALAILAVSMLFANWADALSNTFNAFEKMEYPAGLSTACNLIKIAVGPLVLLLGGGFVGLAVLSLVVNLIQTVWFYRLLRITLFRPQWQWDWPLQRWMVGVSAPLMINHLLATIFWRIDIWILRPLAGEASVGLYSVGIKYLDGLNVIPSIFTLAIFPLMSRYARSDSNNLLRAYRLSLRLLILVSLPIAMAVTFLAEPLVYLVGGAQYLNIDETIRLFGREFHYLGGSDVALQVIIWSIPIGFVNSVTQYVLIAVNQQRYLTRAFLLGVTLNIVGNLLLIPSMGYIGAAAATILSEFSLLVPFYASVRRHVGTVPWLALFTPPLLAVALMGGATYALLLIDLNPWLAVLIGGLVYLAGLVITGALRGDDMALVGRSLPLGPLRRWALPTTAQ